jgi:hypothetical protein
MYVDFHLICGFSIGFEYVPDWEDESHFAVDLGILRIMVSRPHDDGDEEEVELK